MSVQIVKDKKFQPVAGELNKTAVFAGQITMGANISAPYGWLLCDGTAYNIDDYKSLFAAIGKTYNKPDTPTGQFCVPDMRNQFAMGAGTNALGSKVEAALPNIKGDMQIYVSSQQGQYYNSYNTDFDGAIIPKGTNYGIAAKWGSGAGLEPGKDKSPAGFSLDAHNSNPIYKDGATVTPPSIALNYFIKY